MHQSGGENRVFIREVILIWIEIQRDLTVVNPAEEDY